MVAGAEEEEAPGKENVIAVPSKVKPALGGETSLALAFLGSAQPGPSASDTCSKQALNLHQSHTKVCQGLMKSMSMGTHTRGSHQWR